MGGSFLERESKPVPDRAWEAGQLEHEANRLWKKRALWLLVLLAAAIVRLQNHPYSLRSTGRVAAVDGAVRPVCLRAEVGSIPAKSNFVQHGVGSVRSQEQLHQLGQKLRRSQRGLRELIDSSDHVAFAVLLDGTLCAVNRQFANRARSFVCTDCRAASRRFSP